MIDSMMIDDTDTAILNELELVLQQEEIVGGRHGDDVFVRVPRRV